MVVNGGSGRSLVDLLLGVLFYPRTDDDDVVVDAERLM
jgi:hypothetical protein